MEDHLDQITFQKARSSACLARGQRDKHELTTKLCQNDFGSRSTFYENINCIKALLQMSLKFIFVDACNFSQRNQSCEKMILLSQVFFLPFFDTEIPLYQSFIQALLWPFCTANIYSFLLCPLSTVILLYVLHYLPYPVQRGSYSKKL